MTIIALTATATCDHSHKRALALIDKTKGEEVHATQGNP